MRLACLILISLAASAVEPFPVIPLQFTPDQIALSLRTTKPPMPAADCAALGVFACKLEYPMPVGDISIRWVQLDDDPELEAIIVAYMKSEWDYFVFIFDWNKTWKLVGNMMCLRHCYDRGPSFVSVQKLTENAPVFVNVRRDRGGSGSSLNTQTFLHLRNGRLQEAFEVVEPWIAFPLPAHTEKIQLLQSGRWLVQHTTREEPPGSPAKHSCHVFTWNAMQLTFLEAPAERPSFCNPRTGRPYPDKARPIIPY